MGIVVMLCSPCSRRLPSASSAGAHHPPGVAIAIVACAAAILELNDLPFDWRSDSLRSAYRALAACRAVRWPNSRSSIAESISTSTRATC